MAFVKPMDISRVPGHTFKPSGKWAYEVWLDYTGILDKNGRPVDGNWMSPYDAAEAALKQATEKGTSGVRFSELRDFYLVVFDSPHGFPVMVVPGR